MVACTERPSKQRYDLRHEIKVVGSSRAWLGSTLPRHERRAEMEGPTRACRPAGITSESAVREDRERRDGRLGREICTTF